MFTKLGSDFSHGSRSQNDAGITVDGIDRVAEGIDVAVILNALRR